MVDFSDLERVRDLAERIRLSIDNNSVLDNPSKFEMRVPTSSIGDECLARLWYKFHWAGTQTKPGFVSRMFEKGSSREADFTAMLRRDGWELRDYAKRLLYHPPTDDYVSREWDAHSDAQDQFEMTLVDVSQDSFHINRAKLLDHKLVKQWKYTSVNGHMISFSDGRARHPVFTDNVWIGVEYKTANTRNFSTMRNKHSLQISNPKYYAQVILYTTQFELPATLFLVENKNDSDIHAEIIPRDDNAAMLLERNALSIVTSRAPLAKVAQSSTHHICKMCDLAAVCHSNAPMAINCRSCTHCEPIEDGKFTCSKWQAIIPNREAMEAGCPSYRAIK